MKSSGNNPEPGGELRWDSTALRDPHAQPDKPRRVEAMFDAIAPTYERVNRVTTLGRDAHWRARAIAAADVRAGDVVLDVCCGTGDMLRGFARGAVTPRRLIGVDFAGQMLARGDFDTGAAPCDVVRADALRLPLTDGAVDVISCAFGVRNFADLQAGLNEMGRVMRPGGRVVILEFALPEGAVTRWLVRTYTERVLPMLGAWISRDRTGAYRYLPSSIRTFEPAETLAERLAAAGFVNVRLQRMNFGGVVLYRGTRAGRG